MCVFHIDLCISVSFGFVCQYVSQVIGWGDLLSWYLSCEMVSPTKTADWRVIYCNWFIVCIPNTL